MRRLLFCLFLSVAAFRLDDLPRSKSRRSGVDVDGELRHLPPTSEFQELWLEKFKKEPLSASLPRDVRLVLGVFAVQSFSDSEAIRATIKNTWMQRSSVCELQGGLRTGCSVYTAFILGERSPFQYRGDEVVLNVTENMNNGKSCDFFRHAATAYPWATHIGKMDLDTFPYLHSLTWSLSQHAQRKRGCESFVGKGFDWEACGRKFICPPRGCGLPLQGDFLKYLSPNCWSYMQGGLYIMSYELAKGVSEGPWQHNRFGYEDLQAGRSVSQYATAAKICVDAWDPEAWDHLGG